MFDTQSLNVVQIDPAEDPIITHIASDVDIQHPVYADYLIGKFIVAREFEKRYPGYPVEIVEQHDDQSIIIISRAESKRPDGVIRVCFDGKNGLPITDYVSSEYEALKAQGQHLAEVGRMFAEPQSGAYPYLIACVYQLALHYDIDCYLIQIRTKNLELYKNVFGAVVLEETMPCDGCTHMAWHIGRTPKRFHRWYPVHTIQMNGFLGGEA